MMSGSNDLLRGRERERKGITVFWIAQAVAEKPQKIHHSFNDREIALTESFVDFSVLSGTTFATSFLTSTSCNGPDKASSSFSYVRFEVSRLCVFSRETESDYYRRKGDNCAIPFL